MVTNKSKTVFFSEIKSVFVCSLKMEIRSASKSNVYKKNFGYVFDPAREYLFAR